ncbi:tetratricopeptide repeat protein [Zoogloea sp.]|uniref:tetratricopeptide repeat protein n=1 Tax=Zoogloea sp. TaxID=49181 RepID=UPI0031FBE3CA
MSLLGATAEALSPPEVFESVAPLVAVLDVLDGDGRLVGRSSATRLAGGRFVSACEVLESGSAYALTLAAGSLPGRIVARDRERNLCLLEAAGAEGAAGRRAPPPAPGSRVFAVSNAAGLGVGISEGVLSGVRHFPGGDYIQFTAPISPGSEGGALVDATGALIGIVDYRRRDGQNVNFASLAAWIDEIEARSAAAADQLQRFDEATTLSRASRWAELDTLASGWARKEPGNGDAWGFVGIAARGLKQREREQEAWRSMWRIHPDRPAVGVSLGAALLEAGKPKEALEVARSLVLAHQEFAPAHWVLGQSLRGLGQFQEAEAAYRRALELDPLQISAYQGLAELAGQRGDHLTQISLWSRLAGLYPEQLWPRYALVQAYLAAGKPERAHAVLARLPEAAKDSAVTWYWRGVVESRLARPEAAADAFRAALARRFPEVGWCWLGIGLAMAEMRRFPEAIGALEAAREANPDEDSFAYPLGGALKEGGRPVEALALFEKLAAKAPGEARNWQLVGGTLTALDRRAEAIPALERSLQIKANQPEVWRVLIESLQILARRADAMNAWQRLRAIDEKAADQAWTESMLPAGEARR